MPPIGVTKCWMHRSTEVQDDALPLAIQHQKLHNDRRAIATLLCISKRFTIALKRRLFGLVPVLVRLGSVQDAQLFANWLAANCPMVKSLDIGFKAATIEKAVPAEEATVVLAQAVAASVKTLPGLPLQHVVLNELANEPELLRQLSHCKCLTQLEIMLPCSGSSNSSAAETFDGSHPVPAACLTHALSGLSQLHSLALHSRWLGRYSSTDSLLPDLHTLHHLTFLGIDEPRCLTTLEQLPKQLLHLELTRRSCNTYAGCSARQPMNLNHLTALTAITYSKPYIQYDQAAESGDTTSKTASSSTDVGTAFSDMEGAVPGLMQLLTADQLPPALQHLTVGGVLSPKPLQQLQRLQYLEVTGSNLEQPVLQVLAEECQQLRSLLLTYNSATSAVLEQASAVWQFLPLTALCLRSCPLSRVLMQQLVHVSSLMALQLEISDQDVELPPFVALPQQLTGLHKLAVSGMSAARFPATLLGAVYAAPGTVIDLAVSVQQELCQRLLLLVAACKQLCCFSFDSYAIVGQDTCLDFSALIGATQLTALRLKNVGLQDSALMPLACNLTGLKELDVSHNKLVSSKSLMAIARSLQHLTYLDVRETAVNQLTATWAVRQVALPLSCVLQASQPAKRQKLSSLSDITFAVWGAEFSDHDDLEATDDDQE